MENKTAAEILNKKIDFSLDGVIEIEKTIEAMEEYASIICREKDKRIHELKTALMKLSGDKDKLQESLGIIKQQAQQLVDASQALFDLYIDDFELTDFTEEHIGDKVWIELKQALSEFKKGEI